MLKHMLDYGKLQAFFEEVATLTVHHDVVYERNEDGNADGHDDNIIACVAPSDLSVCLSRVDPNWIELAHRDILRGIKYGKR